MIVIAKDTEGKLLKELDKARAEKPTQRCFYLALSKAELPKKKLFEAFLTALYELPNSYTAQVFICADRDVFILISGFMQRHFEDFVQDLSETLEAPEIVALAYVFELGIHWQKIRQICQDKIFRIDRESSRVTEEQRREFAEKIALETVSKIDLGTIYSISDRRNSRTEPSVLIVDDDQLSRTLAGNVLREDYGVNFAKDGKEALKGYVDVAPDIVFLDIGMPDLSGHEVLETLFQIDPQAYVIMFSGRKDKENMMRALETGAQGFLGKPFTREKLYSHVQQSPFVKLKQGSRPKHPSGSAGGASSSR